MALVNQHAAIEEHLEDRIRALGPWFYNLRIHGVETAPDHFLGDYPEIKFAGFRDAIPQDLSGKSVLDIGCNAGLQALLAGGNFRIGHATLFTKLHQGVQRSRSCPLLVERFAPVGVECDPLFRRAAILRILLVESFRGRAPIAPSPLAPTRIDLSWSARAGPCVPSALSEHECPSQCRQSWPSPGIHPAEPPSRPSPPWSPSIHVLASRGIGRAGDNHRGHEQKNNLPRSKLESSRSIHRRITVEFPASSAPAPTIWSQEDCRRRGRVPENS